MAFCNEGRFLQWWYLSNVLKRWWASHRDTWGSSVFKAEETTEYDRKWKSLERKEMMCCDQSEGGRGRR